MISSLARHRGIPITAVSTRLTDFIDPDALDELFAPTFGNHSLPGRIRYRRPESRRH
ncbi:MAG: HalOD1 output domain-containing protein [Natrialbaceae archaeon]|nr:HalOD1 output domain-containing protein [Natrialbaceae archaeon]